MKSASFIVSFTVNSAFLVSLLALLILSTSCASPRSTSSFKQTSDFSVFRDYRLTTEDVDPQPAWAPDDYRIVVRSKSGLGLLDEGPGNQKFFNTKDFSKIAWPTWLDNETVVVGAPDLMTKTEEGEITQSHVKLRLLTAKGMQLKEAGFLGNLNAYYPRAATRYRLLAQKNESIIEVTKSGDWHEYDQGFYALPQFNGPGVCLQTVPIYSKDYWTGQKGNGDLLVRWHKGSVSVYANCFQARWCKNGGIVATRLNGNIDDVKQWQDLDSDVVYIDPQSKKLSVIKEHAHSPAANPSCMVAACVGRGGYLYLVDLAADAQAVEVVPEGNNPQWSFDGQRLLTEVPALDKTINLRVWVFKNAAKVAP